MGRGLSQQQKDILAILPPLRDGMDCCHAPTTRDIIAMLGLDITPSNRASVSRAVSRLQARGLVLHLWGFCRGNQRKGYTRASAEQVKARRDAQSEFLGHRTQSL